MKGKGFKEGVVCPNCKEPTPWDRHKNDYCSKKCESAVEGYNEKYQKRLQAKITGGTGWRPRCLEPTKKIQAKRIGILSDVHCPVFSEEWLMQAVVTFKHFDINAIILNGDFIDAHRVGRHIGNYFEGGRTLENDFACAEWLVNMLSEEFNGIPIYLLMGNHDQRVMMRFYGELTTQRIFKMIGEHKNFKVTGRSYMLVNDKIMVGHPRQYSKIRGSLPIKLANRYGYHIMTGHQHHSAYTVSDNGEHWCIDIPCLADVEQQDYVVFEMTTHVQPLNGFAMIDSDRAMVFDKFTPWELLGIPCVLGSKKSKK